MKRFDDIRPYRDEEIPAAMGRIADSPLFGKVAAWLYPDENLEQVRDMLRGYRCIDDFQTGMMMDLNRRVLSESVERFTCSGLERLEKGRSYLFVSNHRDIVLDSSLLQYQLVRAGFRTTEITFGSNLMSSQLLIDAGRSNKMFKVKRGESPRDFYRTSLHLSDYIRHVVEHRGDSVWIAQRSGRTKNGNDATDQGIVKMFAMSGEGSAAESLIRLNIIPVSISYQWEPCDLLKVAELCKRHGGKPYVKAPDEDLHSVLTGILQRKGGVHLSVCKPLRPDELRTLETESAPNAFFRGVATLIDRRIHNAYQLWDTNYAAYDLLNEGRRYAAYYTPELREEFTRRYLDIRRQTADINPELAARIFLGIYANPVNSVYFTA